MAAFLKKYNRQLALFGISVILLSSVLLIVRELRKPQPVPNYSMSERAQETTIVIPSGSSGDEIAQILYKADVVKSARSFFSAATANPNSQSIQPGTYRINRKIPGKEAVLQLLDPKRRSLVLLIKEGERVYEIASALSQLNFSSNEIDQISKESVDIPGFGERNPEGFFFPATYNLTPNDDLKAVKDRLLGKFISITKEIDFQNRAKLLGLTPYDALIISSIVQSEGFDEQEFRKVARVIYNRLEIGMPLQLDSTVLYALKERRIAVNKQDIEISSRYNTYNRQGLPPTPIGNPGRAAMEGTLNPDVGDWLYFVTVEPGSTKFTASYKEFLSFKREFKENLKAGKFGSDS